MKAHGDHWIAALGPSHEGLAQALSFPLDAPEGVALHRQPLTAALDRVQITARRRILTAFPEPRATTLARLKPRALELWETRVEGWLVAEHATVGTLTIFLTDLVENAKRYEKARGPIDLELGALAYTIESTPDEEAGPERMRPATIADTRFLPDDYLFEAAIREVRPADGGAVLDLEVHGGLVVPTVVRNDPGLSPGARAHGVLWLTGRWAEGQQS